MVDYTYKLDLDEPVEMGSRFKQEPRKGIGAQPKKEEPEADGWADMFWSLIKGYFGDEDEANKALGPKQPSTSYDMDEALETLKGVSRISEPVIEGAPEKFSMPKPEPFKLEVDTIGNEALDRDATRFVDVTDTEEGKLTNVKPLYELAEAIDPGTIDTSELPGKGLMSPRLDKKGETSFYNPDVVTKEGKAGLKEAQKVLKGLGYYGAKIDGETGPSTSNAIKVYQYDNDLEVTGELDSATKKKLAEGGTSVPKPENELLASISEHEGSYGAANNGTSSLVKKKFSVPGTYYSDTYNKPLTEMTVNEILNAQNGTTGKTDAELLLLDPETETAIKNRDLFAVGAYQIIPTTMQAALAAGSVSGDETFSPELQDRVALQFLAGSDRPKLRDYIRGVEGASLEDAAMDLAKQWASFPVPKDVYNKKGKLIAKKGSTRYGSGNRALHDLTSTKNMLKSVREAFIQQVQTAVP